MSITGSWPASSQPNVWSRGMLRGMLEIPFHYLPIHLSLLASCFPDQQALDFLLEEISDIFRANNQLFVPIHQLLFWTTWFWRLIFLPPDSPAVATPLLASPVRKIVLSDRVVTENSVNIMPLLLGTHSTHPSADWNIRFHFCSWSDEVFHFFVLLIRIIMYCKHYFTVCTAGSQQLKYPEPRYE